MSLWQRRLFVAAKEIQKTNWPLLLHVAFLPPPPLPLPTALLLQIRPHLLPIPPNPNPFFPLFLSFLKPTGGYVARNMLICYAPATPWVKITY